jgi:hypothetical protein
MGGADQGNREEFEKAQGASEVVAVRDKSCVHGTSVIAHIFSLSFQIRAGVKLEKMLKIYFTGGKQCQCQNLITLKLIEVHKRSTMIEATKSGERVGRLTEWNF